MCGTTEGVFDVPAFDDMDLTYFMYLCGGQICKIDLNLQLGSVRETLESSRWSDFLATISLSI